MANIIQNIIENDKKQLKKLHKMAEKVEAYEADFANLPDEALQAKTSEFKARYEAGETLDELLSEAFAVAREGAKRVLGLFPYHVQIMGGIVLHNGDVPEMRTGEGKTLTATMPVYLNAIAGKGVHPSPSPSCRARANSYSRGMNSYRTTPTRRRPRRRRAQ